jgi:DNA-binding PadR family transcriptional regulator
MYADNTLTPREAVRLCALGTLASGPMHYSELATAIRHFVSHISGPSLDVMGTSLELLKYEGLVTAVEGVGMEDDAVLSISKTGEAELRALLTANVRAQGSEMNKLIVALKFRFLHLLDKDEQRAQADVLIEAQDTELARLDELRQHHSEDDGYLVEWLDHDIHELEANLAWLRDFRARFG